jgi:hypothetical protein
MNAGNTNRQWRMSDEQDKWEPTPACRNVQQATHDELQDLGTNTEKWLVCKYLVVSPQAKMPSEICTSRREDNIKVNPQRLDVCGLESFGEE